MAICDIIPLMELIKEMREHKFDFVNKMCFGRYLKTIMVHLNLPDFQDSAPDHFHEHARNGLIKIFPNDTNDQIADVLTKALAQNDFV